MPAQAMIAPDARSPRSPKRFFGFGREPLTPPPPLPPTIAYLPLPPKPSHRPNASDLAPSPYALGQGAQVVRRPSDARRVMRQPLTAGLVTSGSRDDDLRPLEPASAPMLRHRPSQHRMQSSSPPIIGPLATTQRRSTLRIKTSISSSIGSSSHSCETPASDLETKMRRTTVKPPPRTIPPIAFNAILSSHTIKPSPTFSSNILINLSFAYSLDDPPALNSMIVPWEKLRPVGGHLVRFVGGHLRIDTEEEGKPDMTDGESAEDSDLESDYGLGALLRDEYLQSLLLTSSPQSKFTHLPPPLPPKVLGNSLPGHKVELEVKKRAQTRNQYTQQYLHPSPSSPFIHTEPLNIRRKVAPLSLEPREVEGSGSITELKILLLRDAAVYGPIIHRLIHGTFPACQARMKRVEEELLWLGMDRLADDLGTRARGRKSMVLKGGEGYI